MWNVSAEEGLVELIQLWLSLISLLNIIDPISAYGRRGSGAALGDVSVWTMYGSGDGVTYKVSGKPWGRG